MGGSVSKYQWVCYGRVKSLTIDLKDFLVGVLGVNEKYISFWNCTSNKANEYHWSNWSFG